MYVGGKVVASRSPSGTPVAIALILKSNKQRTLFRNKNQFTRLQKEYQIYFYPLRYWQNKDSVIHSFKSRYPYGICYSMYRYFTGRNSQIINRPLSYYLADACASANAWQHPLTKVRITASAAVFLTVMGPAFRGVLSNGLCPAPATT